MHLVWIETEGCWGKVIKTYPEFCIVKFFKDGIFYEELIEKEDLIDVRDMGIDYESEEDI